MAGGGVGVVFEDSFLYFIVCDVHEGEVILKPVGDVWVEVLF